MIGEWILGSVGGIGCVSSVVKSISIVGAVAGGVVRVGRTDNPVCFFQKLIDRLLCLLYRFWLFRRRCSRAQELADSRREVGHWVCIKLVVESEREEERGVNRRRDC